jgi:hypothetical protein
VNSFFSIFDLTPCARGAKKEKTLWQPTVRKRSLEKNITKKGKMSRARLWEG